MKIFLTVIFYLSMFFIFWANIGYAVSLKALDKIFKKSKNKKDTNYEPNVSIVIVAHNEEKVIEKKLNNMLNLDYPINKLEVIVTSDYSTDKTNEIVENFIKQHKDINIRLHKTKDHKGKTNAQNEAVKTIQNEIIVFTDANSILKENAIKELVSSYSSDDIAYVTGRLAYINGDDNDISSTENTYWNLDLKIRDIESRFQTITAGNGALYSCRTKYYHEFEPISCHDGAMPLYYALIEKRAIANNEAIAYEKAGETQNDEFKRKVRMNRRIVRNILPNIKILNIFKYKWFTYFYIGHRSLRYSLWINHILFLITNIILLNNSWFYILTLLAQLIVYGIAIIEQIFKTKNKIFKFCNYYCMTIVAQTLAAIKYILGKSKPVWEKAESTR